MLSSPNLINKRTPMNKPAAMLWLNFFALALCYFSITTASLEAYDEGFLQGQPDTSEEIYGLLEQTITNHDFKYENISQLTSKGKAKREVMLWVSYSVPNATTWNGILANINKHKNSITQVCINGYGVTAAGTFGDSSRLNNTQYARKYAHRIKAMGLPVTIMVTGSYNKTYLLKMLYSPKLKEQFIQTALSEAHKYGYDGYNMDVEQQCSAEGNVIYMDFLKEFAHRLHLVNKTLTSDMGGFCAWADYMRLTCKQLKLLGLDKVFSMDTYTADFQKYTRYVKTAQSGLGSLYAAGMERNKLLASKATMDFLISQNVTGIGIFRNPPTNQAFWDAMAYFKYK